LGREAGNRREARDFRGTACAKAPAMHDVLFSMKRAFHKSTWLGRAVLAGYELTPSRFDVLYLLHKTPRPHLWQSIIRKALGVTAATASVMLRALVRLGLVRRQKSEDDKRQLEVSLTAQGRDLIARADAAVRTKGTIDYLVKRIASAQWWNKGEAFEDVDRLENMLRFVRARLADRACLTYGAHPDD